MEQKKSLCQVKFLWPNDIPCTLSTSDKVIHKVISDKVTHTVISDKVIYKVISDKVTHKVISVRLNFFGLMTFHAPYLPWVLLGFSVLLGNSVVIDLLIRISILTHYIYDNSCQH
jgi:hypothetical protein